MGTNYYAIPIKKIDELQTKKEIALKQCGINKLLINIVTSYFDKQLEEIKPIHIGKSSAGWNFIFNLNEKKYYNDKTSLILFLKENKIENEYGIEFDFDEFWYLVVENKKYNGKPVKKNVESDQRYNKYITIDDLEFLDCEFS